MKGRSLLLLAAVLGLAAGAFWVDRHRTTRHACELEILRANRGAEKGEFAAT